MSPWERGLPLHKHRLCMCINPQLLLRTGWLCALLTKRWSISLSNQELQVWLDRKCRWKSFVIVYFFYIKPFCRAQWNWLTVWESRPVSLWSPVCLSLSGGGRTILLGWPLFSSQGRRRRLQSGCGPSPLTGSIFPLPSQAQKAKPYMRRWENPGGQVGERGAVVRAGVAWHRIKKRVPEASQ